MDWVSFWWGVDVGFVTGVMFVIIVYAISQI